ncbi:MAG TPA: hypothetical protein VF703_06575 [Pyrinomonadaceae bacterium]|jgi:hypothetical protein
MTNEPISTQRLATAVFPATVVEVPDSYTVAINRGLIHGVKKGQVFLIYGLSDKDIIDPETNDNLGKLEIVRGTGVVVNVQEKLALIESDKKSKTKRVISRKPRSTFLSSYSAMEETESIESEGTLLAFDSATIGDKARPV